ncbi:hypothetical protein ACFSCZ_02025 [Siminovitchia sediminis]|uniref:Uncharacterized protein n=1 Tax=Siminovitchia sediminis TaxID=1274353 RepID=A0ABW4KCK4_9BACI
MIVSQIALEKTNYVTSKNKENDMRNIIIQQHVKSNLLFDIGL